ncbi:MAG: acetyl-CoA hydrolase/transferase C-terminal domain-containing protein [Pseudomonadota bacterium]
MRELIPGADGLPELSGIIRRGDMVMWGQAAAEPVPLTQALMAQRHAIGAFSVFIGATWSDLLQPALADCVRFLSYCGAARNRVLSKAALLDILPCHYSHIGAMIGSGALKIDVLMLQVAPPDAQGRYSLSIACEYLVPAIRTARLIIAEVNQLAPSTCGPHALTTADIDFYIETSRPPLAPPAVKAGASELGVARNVASLIVDGATLQCGIGALPETILAQLGDRRDLGVHSGTIGDQVALLSEAGVITNARKSIDRGITVGGILMGSQRIHDFAHRNTAVQLRSVDYTHSAAVLAEIDHLVAINSAVEVDLTGQINAEMAGGVYVGAVGGALDFLRAARHSQHGLPIIALPSRTEGSAVQAPLSRIVATLQGPVSTARSDAGVIVTEHGIADLRGLSITQRVRRMIAIAHPDMRDELERKARMLNLQ